MTFGIVDMQPVILGPRFRAKHVHASDNIEKNCERKKDEIKVFSFRKCFNENKPLANEID
jgi:hypothetical protein